MTITQVEPPPNDYAEEDMIQALRDLYESAKQSKGQMTNEWKRNYRMTMNRAAPAVPSAPGTRANEIYPTVDARVGWMTDQEIQFSMTPAADPFSPYYATNDVLCQHLEQVLNSVYKTDGWYAEIVKMFWDAAMYGAGFLKCVWDAGLVDGMGNVAMKHVSPWCLYVDPYASNLDDAQYIIEVHTMTPAEIERRFPSTEDSIVGEVSTTGDKNSDHVPPSQTYQAGKQLLDYRSNIMLPVNAGQGATTWGRQGQAKYHTMANMKAVNVYECWIRENDEEWVESSDPSVGTQRVIVDRWRVVVFASNRILLDETAENLFHDDRHPYVRYVDVETGEFWGSPLLRDLAPCQQALNTLLAMGQNNIVYTGNPIMIGVKGSGVERATFFSRPGMVYDVNASPQNANTKPAWLPPPNLPPALMEFVMFWRDEMERIAGLSSTQRGEVPSGRATDKQVQSGQEAGFIRIRSSQRNFELTLRKAGELLANLIVINYDVPRFVAVVGDEGEMSAIRLAAQHFYGPTLEQNGDVTFAPLRFTVTVNAGSAKPTSRAARIQEANMLKQMNVVDDQFVLQSYRVSHWQDVLKRKQQQQQMEAQILQMQQQNKRQASPKGPK